MQSGCFQYHQKKWKSFARFLCIIGVFLAVKSTCVAQESAKQPVLRNRVYKFRHISASNAKERLVSLGIGRNINELPHNSLIVESDNPAALVKASSLLDMIDSEQPFVIKTILVSPDIQKLPRNDEIAAELGDIIVGTFKEPPTDSTKPCAIVDIHNGDLIAIAPEPLFTSIADVVHRLQAPRPTVEATRPGEFAEPNAVPASQPHVAAESAEAEVALGVEDKTDAEAREEPAESAPHRSGQEDLFGDELLEVLAEAEKVAKDKLAEAEKAASEKLAARIREIEKVQSVEKAVKVPQEAGVGAPTQPETGKIGISKEELAAIVQSEVAKALKTHPAGEPAAAPAQKAPPQVITTATLPQEKQDIAEAAKAEKEQVTKPVEQKPPVEYLDQIAIPDAEKELDLTITLPEKVEIIALIEMVGKLLGLNYIYDENQIRGSVMLKVHDGKVKVKDAYALLESALRFKGFVMTRRGGLVTIVPQAQALEYDPTIRTSPQDIQPGDIIVTSIFHLKHVDTSSAEALLKSMKLGTIINSIPETGTLIVTGYAYRMGRIEELLKMIDVAGKPRKFQFRQLQYTIAVDVLPKVQTLAEQLGTISVSISVTQAQAPATPAKPQTAAERRAAARRRTPVKPTTTPPKAGAAARQAVYLDTDERTNRILMIGLVEDIDIVNQLIDTLDVETPDLRTIKEYEIQHVDPSQIIDTLGELGVVSATTTRSTSQRRPTTSTSKTPAGRTAARPTTTTTRTGTETPLEEEPQISILETTNSLLVNALPAQHAMIALVIAHVDRELEEATLPYVVYPLENQDPQELSDVLSKLIEKTSRVKTAAAKDAKVQTRPTMTTPSKLQEEITIVADPKTYSLVVYASKKNQQWIGTLIKKLDEYRPQVLLDVTLVEITKTDDFNYDLNVLSSIPDLGNTSGILGSITGTAETALTSKAIFDKLNVWHSDRNEFIDMQADSGNFTGFYGDKKINALLTAMQTKKYGRILANPKLLVDDNQEGTIETKSTTYITRTTSSTQIPDTGSPFTSTDIKFEPYDASIKLDIKPHISKGNNLRLEITLMRSDFVNLDPASTKPPDQASSDVVTVVTVPDGSTIILGGMDKTNQSKGGDKVPILGDIPLLGGLFRKTSNTNFQSKLYIFVKANILRPGTNLTSTELIEISRENRTEFEGKETEMQEYEDWPGIRPGVMDPLHILEADELRPQ